MKIFICVFTLSLISTFVRAQESNPSEVVPLEQANIAEAAVVDVDASSTTVEAEANIPVLEATPEKNVQKKPISTSRVTLSIGLVLSALLGFYMFFKKMLKKSPLAKNSQIKILTQHYLGPKRSLAIIRVAGESMLIGVTDQNINLIKTLALLDEEIPQDTPRSFEKSFSDIVKRDQTNQTENLEDDKEDFSISKIKDFVSGRLKNMREI